MKRMKTAAFGAAATSLLSTLDNRALRTGNRSTRCAPPPEFLPMTCITVAKVAIEAGRLTVEGKTAEPRRWCADRTKFLRLVALRPATRCPNLSAQAASTASCLWTGLTA